MRNRLRPLVALSSCILAASSIACAHAPAPAEADRNQKPAVPAKVFVTGSHIAQRVDPTTGLPLTISPVRIYGREQLIDTGRQGDLDAALRAAVPSVTP